METGRRLQRIEKEIRHVVSTHLLTSGQGRVPGVVSVAEVAVSPDLRQAKVYLSFLGSPDQRDEFLDGMDSIRHEAQSVVARTLKMKFSPRLKFFVSQGLDIGLL